MIMNIPGFLCTETAIHWTEGCTVGWGGNVTVPESCTAPKMYTV